MKKIVCINNYSYNVHHRWNSLTIGKIYDLIEEDGTTYWLKNDNMSIGYYDKDMFKSLSKIRNEKIDRLLR